MYDVGSLSKADLAQLDAQVATDEYNLVNIKGELEDYKLQMKNLLRLNYDYVFDIALPSSTDEQALGVIPSAKEVLDNALSLRPEMQNAKLGVEASNLDIEIAKLVIVHNKSFWRSGDKHANRYRAKLDKSNEKQF